MSYIQFSFNLFPHAMHFVDGDEEFGSHGFVIVLRECSTFILAQIVAVETVLQCERVRDLELFPGDNTRCPDFVRLDPEATVFVVEHVGLLRENAW